MSELNKNPKKETDISSEDYADLLDQYQFSTKELTPGKLIKGKVIKVTGAHVLVDVGFKSEGIIPIEDFYDHQDPKTLQPGDDIEAVLEKSNLREGYLVLSKKKLMFVQEKGLFSKSYDTLIDAPYKKIEGVKATDTQHLELTYNGKTHYFISSGGITTPLIEQGLKKVM